MHNRRNPENPEALLDSIEPAIAEHAEAAEDASNGGIDRREFMFMSLVAAAATTFGAHPSHAQRAGGGAGGAGAAGGAAQQETAIPLGNGEPPVEQFMPYPGGTGALMEKLVKEHGPSVFTRSSFTVDKWSGAVPTSDDDIVFLPAHRLSALIKEKRITSTKLTQIYLTRLKKLNPTLLCAVTIMEQQGLAEAARADEEIKAGKYRGPLHGLPYGVKDLFSTKGVPTTWGAADFENRIIDEDAEVVTRLRDAGAVLIAKLATGLFAQNDQWFRGRTNNPWNLSQGSSGSSAGPASATAAGCVAFGIGTETSGSIVSPTTRCGLSALRPTFGRVSRYGGMVLAWTQDRVGPICRTVEDAAMVFNAIHGVDEKDPSTVMTPFHFDPAIKLASLRIGVDPNAPPEMLAKLRELGMKSVDIGARPTVATSGGGLGVEGAAAF
ncbi:MAG TPA: amidase, partial [Casimicrobiaceae bacterium]